MDIATKQKGLRIKNERDEQKNDQFMWIKCAEYLKRHIARHSLDNDELMQLVCKILGNERITLSNLLLSCVGKKLASKYAEELAESGVSVARHPSIPDKNQANVKIPRGVLKLLSRSEREKMKDYFVKKAMKNRAEDLQQALVEAGEDVSDYAEILVKMIKKINSQSMQKLRRVMLGLIDMRIRGLQYPGKSDLEKNIQKLAEIFSLSPIEQELILFLFVVKCHYAAEAFFDTELKCNEYCGRRFMVNILGISQADLIRSIEKFEQLGLIEMYSDGEITLEDDMVKFLQNSSGNLLTKYFYQQVTKRCLPLSFHMQDQDSLRYVLSLLENTKDAPKHILLYGPPGTGKTSFAHGLAAELKMPAYEVAIDEKNESKKRRTALLACMKMTNTENSSLIIVDEADNLLNTQGSWFFRGETQDKGWLNRIMEEPGARVVWITNGTSHIEDSVLRRFAFSIHFKPFNRKQRVQLWGNITQRNKVKRFLGAEDVNRLARKYQASAGAIDMAVKSAKETSCCSREMFLQSLEMSLIANETLHAEGVPKKDKNGTDEVFTIEGLNADCDINEIKSQLTQFDHTLISEPKNSINMNLLFYGPPGTGKSVLARYIADHLGREVICKRFSDLQSMWVGQGEKNVRMAFQEAEDAEAVLVIDEVDSMLFSRDKAQRSWEVSFTNEFLTGMEHYRGILICTTNRLDELDQASIRRFNWKIKFDFLNPEGKVIFYRKLLGKLVASPLDAENISALRRLSNLAPGDFKNVRDRYAFHTAAGLNHKVLIDAIAEESRIKNLHAQVHQIGF